MTRSGCTNLASATSGFWKVFGIVMFTCFGFVSEGLACHTRKSDADITHQLCGTGCGKPTEPDNYLLQNLFWINYDYGFGQCHLAIGVSYKQIHD